VSDVVTVGSEIEIRVEKLVAGGDGFGRYDGRPVFIARAAPGDLLRVRVSSAKRDYLRAEIVEIVTAGAGRRQPPCPHFAVCGGCDLQHIEDDLQVELKVAAVRETLERLGGVELPADLEVHSGSPFGYRLRNRVRIEAREAGYAVGYRAAGSWTLVPITSCKILVPELESLVVDLGPLLPAGRAPERLDLAVGDDGSITTSPVVEGLGHGEVTRRVGDFVYAFDARCFFQGHVGLLDELVEAVVGTGSGECAWDLYAGVGLFSLPLARRYAEVVAIEGDTVAARYARINARRNRARNVEVVSGSLDSRIGEMPAGVDRVVVDPPRAGLTPSVLGMLLERRPSRLTYVSCHPAALARDLRRLSPGYRLVRAALFDLFPQTGHMETVIQLESGFAPAGR
jgi:23S rRNA (uracil1939-C5)-methyltransferase